MHKLEMRTKTLTTRVYLIRRLKLLFKYCQVFVWLGCIVCISCKSDNVNNTESAEYTTTRGNTMGTTYNLVYLDKQKKVNTEDIETLLLDINQSVSTYIDNSEISEFNKAGENFGIKKLAENEPILKEGKLNPMAHHNHFITNYIASKEIYHKSQGLFDPTCMGLVNYWGFGYKHKTAISEIDKNQISSILEHTGFDKLTDEMIDDVFFIKKSHPTTQLDFSAIAKGYGVDKVLEYLKACGVNNALVEIGGETKTVGVNRKNNPWQIGINTPSENARLSDYEEIVSLSGKAMASSGNYRNFYEIDGKKYGHEINPKTGFPVQTEILSASVIAESCMYADGYATACMIMDVKNASEMIEKEEGVEALFILGDGDGYKKVMTSGFSQYLN